MDYLKRLLAEHEKLKKRIHAFRIPLSPRGQKIMGLIYFSIPVIMGYFIMQFTNEMSLKNLKAIREHRNPNMKTKQQNEALGDMLEKIKRDVKGNE
jgi:hypothetical protein